MRYPKAMERLQEAITLDCTRCAGEGKLINYFGIVEDCKDCQGRGYYPQIVDVLEDAFDIVYNQGYAAGLRAKKEK